MFCFFQFLSRYFKTFYAFELKSLKAYLYFTIISSNDAIWWTNLPLSIRVCIISSVMHAFWLVLTHDLLEDRRIDDVIIKIFFLIHYYIKQRDSKFFPKINLFDVLTKMGHLNKDTSALNWHKNVQNFYISEMKLYTWWTLHKTLEPTPKVN